MSPKTRFRVWMVAIALPLMGAPLLHIGGCAGVLLPAILAGLGLGTQFVLLRTTPSDAIKLPYWTSVVLVAVGAVWVQSNAAWSEAVRAARAGNELWEWPLVHLLIVTAIPSAAWLMLGKRRAVCHLPSPWWLALACWSPAPSLVMNEFNTGSVWLSALPFVACGLSVMPGWLLAAMRVLIHPTPMTQTRIFDIFETAFWPAACVGLPAGALALCVIRGV